MRPDALVPWIEEQTGVTLPTGPAPAAELLVAESGGEGSVAIQKNDPRAGASHVYSVVGSPAHGTAEVGSDGVVTFQADEDYIGADAVEVEIVDAADATRIMRVTVPVDVIEATDDGGCGCRTGGDAAGALPLLVAGLLLTWRRRRGSRAR